MLFGLLGVTLCLSEMFIGRLPGLTGLISVVLGLLVSRVLKVLFGLLGVMRCRSEMFIG